MFNFFVNSQSRQGNRFIITGPDYNHIKNVLRMNISDNILVSEGGVSHLCNITGFNNNAVIAEILKENYQNTELPVKIFLFQGLPKGEKTELIIQKSVELGVAQITPVEMSHCVVKLDSKKKAAKTNRWQLIAESAAKQSKCSFIPKVCEPVTYKEALKQLSNLDLFLLPYENEEGMGSTKKALQKIRNCKTVGILIGPEGGFSDEEIALANESGATLISLGKRILRTETAAITAVGMCMLKAEMDFCNE